MVFVVVDYDFSVRFLYTGIVTLLYGFVSFGVWWVC